MAAAWRRSILAACGGALLAASVTRRATAQTAVSPDDALKRLMDGNRRYMAKQLSSFTAATAIAAFRACTNGEFPFPNRA